MVADQGLGVGLRQPASLSATSMRRDHLGLLAIVLGEAVVIYPLSSCFFHHHFMVFRATYPFPPASWRLAATQARSAGRWSRTRIVGLRFADDAHELVERRTIRQIMGP